MAWPIVIVASGGLPVTDTFGTTGLGTPVEEAANGYGVAVTFVAAGGAPVVQVFPVPPIGNDNLFGADSAPLKGADGAYLFGAA